jgi:hypothetical protein
MKTLVLAALLFAATPALAMIDAFPSYLNFGDTTVGRRSLPRTVTITNRGQQDVTYVNVFPSCGLDFDITSNSCYGPLRPYQSCYINISFSPYREGYQSCSITISSSVSSAYISASGRGVKRNIAAPTAAKKPRPMPARK